MEGICGGIACNRGPLRGYSRRDGVFRFFFTFFGGLLAKITHTHGDRCTGALPLADSVYAAASVTMECFCTLGPFSPREEEEDSMP